MGHKDLGYLGCEDDVWVLPYSEGRGSSGWLWIGALGVQGLGICGRLEVGLHRISSACPAPSLLPYSVDAQFLLSCLSCFGGVLHHYRPLCIRILGFLPRIDFELACF